MKKARDWLDGHGVAYAFHDYKTRDRSPAPGGLEQGIGLGDLLNKAGTTFRKLPDADKQDRPGQGHRPDAGQAVDDQAAGSCPTSMGDQLLVGFKPDVYGSSARVRGG
jgi:arsenate reductase